MTYYIPIGYNCWSAGILRELDLRKESLPFDWMFTFKNISREFEQNFEHFYTNYPEGHHVGFEHGKPPERRIDRLRRILSENEDILFLRLGHTTFHCNEKGGSLSNEDEIEEMIKLDKVVGEKYSHLSYKIYLFLCCVNCNNSDPVMTKGNVVIYTLTNLPIDIDRYEFDVVVKDKIKHILTNYVINHVDNQQ